MASLLPALAGVANAAEPLPNLLTGGQPGPDHFAALAAAGVRVILDIRDPMEPRPFDEARLVAELGMRYLNVPVTSLTMDEATMDRLLGIVRESAGEPMLFHCASGNRVGGALLAHLMLDHGMTEEDAIGIAMRGGLRGADVLHWGLGYAQSRPRG